MIPLFANREALEPLLDEVMQRQRDVVESGRYILGPEVEAFEREFADYIGRSHCVGVASGTDALTIGLRAAGVGPGDEVVVPAMSFFATAEAVVHAGATPVFADIDPMTRCVSAATIEAVCSPKTRAVVPVHLFGNVAPMEEICDLAEERGLYVLEDAAQAAGASLRGRRAGAWGDAGAFSFYPGKNLGAFGDAGALVTDDPEIAERARLLRVHGTEAPWRHTDAGYTSRLDAIQAAALRVLLPELDGWNTARRAAADNYGELGLSDFVEIPIPTPGADWVAHLFVVCHPNRDELSENLRASGIETRAYYTTPLHRQPALGHLGDPPSLPQAEALAATGLALPMGPSLAAEDVKTVVDEVRKAVQ